MHPHKSITHEERYVHFQEAAKPQGVNYPGWIRIFDNHKAHTVFFRKEEDGWHASASHCVPSDGFSRRVGRTVARRRYFAGKRWAVSGPGYDQAFQLLLQKLI